ncbi:MAG: RT0821/Lpp0805 family surface protein [Rickettsiales bacterium]|nr:RT0821/Lpp0805 family surface protein [Rickettsiales bacterium]
MKIISTLLLASTLAISACAPQYGPQGNAGGIGGTGITKENVGMIAGGLGGALAAQGVGKGKGNVLAIAGGTILGGLIGGEIGKSLDRADMAYANSTTQNALEQTSSGVTSKWVNPDSGHSGTITPVKTFQSNSGQYCREFSQTINVSGQSQKAFGTACRQQDGSWKIVG